MPSPDSGEVIQMPYIQTDAGTAVLRTLKPGGAFVTKNFQGGDAGGVLADLRAHFREVKFVKPESSRKDSAEVFLVALNKR